MIIIKKYKNRKLYNTETAKYISYPALADLLFGEEDIKIIEADTNYDITRDIAFYALSQHAWFRKRAYELFLREICSAHLVSLNVHTSGSAQIYTRLQGSPNQYYMLRIYNSEGFIKAVYTSKNRRYLERLRKERYADAKLEAQEDC